MKRFNIVSLALLVVASFLFNQSALADAVEQKVWIKPVNEGGQCTVTALFKGDKDNCKNKKAKGRDDCAKDEGCVCSRKEKHIAWQMDGSQSFKVVFDQGDKNPFVKDGSHECNFKSNKKGKLRCRVKGKDTPKGMYRYSVEVPNCESAKLQLKLY